MIGCVNERFEDITRKGENAGYQQVTWILTKCHEIRSLCGKGLSIVYEPCTLQSRLITTLRKKHLENIVEKRKKC